MSEKNFSPEFIKLSNKVDRNFEILQSQTREHKRELESHKKIQNILLTITIGITIAFLAIFILLAVDYLQFTSEYRQRLHDKLEQQGKEINTLNFRILEDKLQTPQDTIIK